MQNFFFFFLGKRNCCYPACGYDSPLTSSLMIQLVTNGNGACIFNKSKTKLSPLWIPDYHETSFGSLSSEWKWLGLGLGGRGAISVVYVCLYLSNLLSLSMFLNLFTGFFMDFFLQMGFTLGNTELPPVYTPTPLTMEKRQI